MQALVVLLVGPRETLFCLFFKSFSFYIVLNEKKGSSTEIY